MQPPEFEQQQARPVAAGHRILLQKPAFLELPQKPRGRTLRLAGEPDHVRIADLRLAWREAAQDLNGVIERAHGLAVRYQLVPESGTVFLILGPGKPVVNPPARGNFSQGAPKIRACAFCLPPPARAIADETSGGRA